MVKIDDNDLARWKSLLKAGIWEINNDNEFDFKQEFKSIDDKIVNCYRRNHNPSNSTEETKNFFAERDNAICQQFFYLAKKNLEERENFLLSKELIKSIKKEILLTNEQKNELIGLSEKNEKNLKDKQKKVLWIIFFILVVISIWYFVYYRPKKKREEEQKRNQI